MLKNKIVLISGGGTGIGKSIADLFAKENMQIIIIGRRKKVLEKTVKKISEYGKIKFYVCDISIENKVSEIINQINNNFGKLDILINNAGIIGEKKTIENYSIKNWQKVININLNGTFYLSKMCIPLLKKGLNPMILNVSSNLGRFGKAEWGAYSVSKFGIEGLSQILSDELSNIPIQVNSINPGATNTAMRSLAYPEENPLTINQPEKIAKMFLDLISRKVKYISGKSIDYNSWKKNQT